MTELTALPDGALTEAEVSRMVREQHTRLMAPFAECARAVAPAWEVVDFAVDEFGAATFGTWGGYWLQIWPMISNERLVMVPRMHPTGMFPGDGSWDYGWCYPRSGRAALALLTWDPGTVAEPDGYVKRAHPGPTRQAGQTARGWTEVAA